MIAALRSPPLTLNIEAVLVDDDVGEDCIGVVLGVEDLAQDDVRQILGHRLPLGRVHVHVEVHSHALLAVAENKFIYVIQRSTYIWSLGMYCP